MYKPIKISKLIFALRIYGVIFDKNEVVGDSGLEPLTPSL